MVKRGRIEFANENRNDGGAKMLMVPVPVRSGRASPDSSTRRIRLMYWYSSCDTLFSPLRRETEPLDMVVVKAETRTHINHIVNHHMIAMQYSPLYHNSRNPKKLFHLRSHYCNLLNKVNTKVLCSKSRNDGTEKKKEKAISILRVRYVLF